MAVFLSNRDGGRTDEQGHYRFQTNVWSGNVIGNGLEVTQNSPLGMSVLVNDGDARIPYSDYAYTAWVDGAEEVTIDTADPTNPRIDRIVMYIDRGETPQTTNPNNPNIPKFAAVAGTPGAVPSRPDDTAVESEIGAGNPFIDLADVLVNDSVTQITDANITDTREIVRSVAGGSYIVNHTFNDATGNQTISGVPFRPKEVQVLSLRDPVNSGYTAYGGAAEYDGTITEFSYVAVQDQDAMSLDDACVLALSTVSGSILVRGSLTSFNRDGATFNFSNTDSNTGVREYALIFRA